MLQYSLETRVSIPMFNNQIQMPMCHEVFFLFVQMWTRNCDMRLGGENSGRGAGGEMWAFIASRLNMCLSSP